MKLKLVLTLLLASSIILALCAACATKEAPQGDDAKKEIVVGFLDDLSGPLASLCSAFVEGQSDALRYTNEKGGIQGHPLRAIIIDHKMDSTLAISGWDRLKSEGVPIVFSVSAPAAVMLYTSCQADQIPILSGGGTMDQLFPKEPSYYFSIVPEYYGIFESLAQLIERDWAKKGEKRTIKVGYDIIAFGNYQKIFTKAAKMASQKHGFEYTITYTGFNPADVTTQTLQMKNFGCDYLYLMGGEVAVIAWLKELERQNVHPVVFGSTGLAATEVWQALGELCVGTTYYTYGSQWTDTDKTGIRMLRELNTKWHPEVKMRSGHYCRSFFNTMAMAEALNRAIQNVGYQNLSGDAMKQAIESLKNYDPGELGIGYTWTPTDHQGVHGCRWYSWTKEGLMTPASEWFEFAPLPEEQRTTAWWLTQ